MRVYCYFCGEPQDYQPRNATLPRYAQKKCVKCHRKFKIKDCDIQVEPENERLIPKLLNVQIHRKLPLIRQLIEYMQSEPLITQSKIKTELDLSKYQAYSLVKLLENANILTVTYLHNFKDKRFKFYILKTDYETKLLNFINCPELPEKLDIHAIKCSVKTIGILDNSRHLSFANTLRQQNIVFKQYEMRGGWLRTIITSNLSNWNTFEINRETIVMNYRGHVLSGNPKKTISDIKRSDLEAALVYLRSLGITTENRIYNTTAHFAYLGVVIKPTDLQIYDKLWVDLSKGVPELETNRINTAIGLLAFAQAVKKTKKALYFQVWKRSRVRFFNALKMWDKNIISYMELKQRMFAIDEFNLNYEQIKRRLLNERD